MISRELLEILCCPETKQKVEIAPQELVTELEQRRTRAELHDRHGKTITAPITAGLIREDGAVFYQIRDGISVMLSEESIALK